MWSGFRSDQYLGLKNVHSICITAAQGENTDVEIRSMTFRQVIGALYCVRWKRQSLKTKRCLLKRPCPILTYFERRNSWLLLYYSSPQTIGSWTQELTSPVLHPPLLDGMFVPTKLPTTRENPPAHISGPVNRVSRVWMHFPLLAACDRLRKARKRHGGSVVHFDVPRRALGMLNL